MLISEINKKKIYELLEKYYSKKGLNASKADFVNGTSNDMTDLIGLFTNDNPFISLYYSNVKFAERAGNKPNALGVYYPGLHQIEYSVPFVESVLNKKENFASLLDTIYHEQRHRVQDDANEKRLDKIEDVDMKKIVAVICDDELSEQELKEMNRFATKHDLIKLNIYVLMVK